MPRWSGLRPCDECGGTHRSKADAFVAHNPNASAGRRPKRKTKRHAGQYGAAAERRRKGTRA